jgi:hypothetical protein
MKSFRFFPIFLAAASVGLLTGCGGGAETPRVASAAGPAGPSASGVPTGAASADVVTQYVAAVRKYVQCMRAEGIDLPDPGPKGEIDYTTLGGNPKQDPKFRAASVKCSPLLPPVPDELQAKPDPLTPQQIQWARQYAKCVRAHGVPDFPDPDADGYFTDSRWQDHMTEQEAHTSYLATETCRPVLDGKPPASPDPKATGQG